MTDRVKGLTVVLTEDIRIDDVEELIKAINMFQFVLDVDKNIVNADDYINRTRIKHEIWDELYKNTWGK